MARPRESIQKRISKIRLTMKSIRQMYISGMTDYQVAETLGITRQGLQKWKEDNKFSCHLKDWKIEADKVIEKSLYERGKGYTHDEEQIFCFQGEVVRAATKKHYPPDPTSMIFWLKNRHPDKWRDKTEVDHSVSINVKRVAFNAGS